MNGSSLILPLIHHKVVLVVLRTVFAVSFWLLSLLICRYIKCFYTYKKINTIFLKLHHSLLRVPEIIEIGLIVSAEKGDSKTYITHARIEIGSGYFKGNTQQ